MAIRKWIVPALDTEAAAVLAEECELNPFLALLLTTRGVKTPEDATNERCQNLSNMAVI